ncbi:MAG: diaminopimelate epimerase [Methylococcales symbiont of Hymedesmia sp. n. MRB-2018]|nr:MAG: diaminopimelate epimerase [Methylococcales symbiont of Hymedesmia sp. n. MRB-2018]
MISFTKMHGLGNDFVVIDAINQQISLSSEQIRFIADRHFGVGCDQLLLVIPPDTASADFKYRIFNADGSEVGQCGNGARCFARFVRDKKLSDKSEIIVDTHSGQLVLRFGQDGLISVNMGIPRHSPKEIPLNIEKEVLFYSIPINAENIRFGAVFMGNPHAVIEVDNIDLVAVSELGVVLEGHAFFPEHANIGFMQVINRQHIKLRVYERGAGETLACGSGACAAAVIGIEQQLLDKQDIQVDQPGGSLIINWQGRGQPVIMKGSADSVFEGKIEV